MCVGQEEEGGGGRGDSLESNIPVFLWAITDPTDLAQGLLATEAPSEAVESPAVTDVAETETGVRNVAQVDSAVLVTKPPPVEALSVVLQPAGGVEPLAEHGDAVLPGEVAQTAGPVVLHGFTHEVISPGVPAVQRDARQPPGSVALLDEDRSVGVQTKAGQVVLGESLLETTGVELVPGEALLQVVREVEAAVQAGEVRHAQPGGRRQLRGRRGRPLDVFVVVLVVDGEGGAGQVVDAVVEGGVVITEAEVAEPHTAGPRLVVVLLEADWAEVPRAELLQGPEDGLLLPPEPPERLDTQQATELQQHGQSGDFSDLSDLQLQE